ncbi:MAG: LysR family transcriptional regulator [Rhodocyclaceae bacterium]|nr:MAG: LysR family transcriptional regulator [Rhodocyclaceae bacterium]
MKLSSIQAFVAVVKAGSIHAAARDLGLSQPALSKSLRALEEDLAAPLLTRSGHGVEPTAYGKAFYQRARVVIDELRKAQEDVVQLRGKLEGRLTVALAPASTLQLAPMVFKDFKRECPDVELHIVEGIWPSVAEPLRNGSVDLAIGPVVAEMPRSELAVEGLFEVQMAVVVRSGHPLAGAKSLQDLMQSQWLHQGTGDSASVLIRRVFADLKMRVPPISVESRSLTATIIMLQIMDLIALLPRAMLETKPLKGTLVAVDLKEKLRPNLLGLIYRSDRPLTRVAQIFATHTRRAAAHLARVGETDRR